MTAVKSLSAKRLTKMVDELAALNAQIKTLEDSADQIKDALKATGFEEIYGTTHRAVISVRESIRFDTAKAKSMLSMAQLAACQRPTSSVSISLYDL